MTAGCWWSTVRVRRYWDRRRWLVRRHRRRRAALSDAMTVGVCVPPERTQPVAALSSPSGVGVAADGGKVNGDTTADVLAEFKGKKAGGGASFMHYLMTHPGAAWALTVVHLRPRCCRR